LPPSLLLLSRAQPGGQSWTARWLRFDNSYFTPSPDASLLRLPTDAVLSTDPAFRPFFLRYAASEAAFFADYAAAHAKLSELGSAFMPLGGIRID
jgi:L-ascorbate peroxidase